MNSVWFGGAGRFVCLFKGRLKSDNILLLFMSEVNEKFEGRFLEGKFEVFRKLV